MCGIAGIATRERIQPCHLEHLDRMSRSLIHRGPDGAGGFHAEQIAIAMRRLSIIDLATGQQPLVDENEELVLICNGEIYNFVELRESLKARGHVFRTGSDCETILHLYQDHGVDCVQHLRGMFAFTLWDPRRKRLLIARDRMGEKPLYVYEKDGLVVFGSELKTLLHSGLVPFRLDPRAVDRYFHYHYVPEPLTPVEGVRKLGAGCLLTIDLEPWKVEERCYWRMDDAPPIDDDPARRIREELETVSELVIRSDVPVGIALSGGLDSSAIAVLAARKYPGVMNAFSVGYTDRPRTDERGQAKELADLLHLPFHEIEIDPAEVVASFTDVVRWQDDPIADMSGFGYHAVARASRAQGVPVLLQGQGGDELLWGYAWVRAALRQSRRKAGIGNGKAPRFLDYLELRWPRLHPRRAPMDWLITWGGLRTSWEAYERDRSGPPERLVFYDLTDQFRLASRHAPRVYTSQFLETVGMANAAEVFTEPRPWTNLDVAITRLICQTYLLENGIAQGDRLSMANSVELRLPLVDYRLVETVIGLRKARSDAGLPPKAWLREAMKGDLPEKVIQRRKQGFQAPMRDWYGPLFARHGRLLEGGALVDLGCCVPRRRAPSRRGLTPGARACLAPTRPSCSRPGVARPWARTKPARRAATR